MRSQKCGASTPGNQPLFALEPEFEPEKTAFIEDSMKSFDFTSLRICYDKTAPLKIYFRVIND